ncbi:MAG: ParB/RepB/Spo0J family partition protein, partial [Lachnospiraceae bacterium]|nr:ParB/RepB/Spo0J family partition protein [Lachnospiraceae bacterium]
AGHRRQRASELAGFANMPCIVRNMTDDEAILAMTDDNLRHREKILPMEKAQSLKMQVEAISHQGTKMEGVPAGDVGKRSTEIVGLSSSSAIPTPPTTLLYGYIKDPKPALYDHASQGSQAKTARPVHRHLHHRHNHSWLPVQCVPIFIDINFLLMIYGTFQQEKGRNKILLLWRQLHPGGDETGRSGKGSFRG